MSASIEKVRKVEALPENDNLDVVTLEGNGRQVITGHNEFGQGQLVVFFEAGTALPADDIRYAHLREQGLRTWHDANGKILKQVIRIGTVKTGDAVSQGVVMHASLFPELAAVMNGEDEDDILHVRNFCDVEEEMKDCMGTEA